jgi:serine phosphatase RsbU (regulator of sigma subunit)
MFGEERLKKWFAASQSKSLEALPSELMQELNHFGRDGQGDDLTLLCVRRGDNDKLQN